MSKESSVGGGMYLLVQAAMLVLYYGGFAPNLPWWVVWFPTLFVVVILVFIIIIFIGILIVAVLN